MRKLTTFLFIFSLLFVAGCQSGEPVYTADMTPEDYFQQAQDRAETGDYQTAIDIYYKMKETFPDNLEKNTWATYEIAFLYHKMRNDTKALEMLDELLALYAQDKRNVLPPAVKQLAETVKDNIVNKDKYKDKLDKANP